MRFFDRAKNHVRGLILGIALVAITTPMASAQNSGGSIKPRAVQGLFPSEMGVRGTLTAEYEVLSRRQYYNKPVTVGWASLGGAGGAAMRGVMRYSPYVGLAMTAADLMGWQLDGQGFHKNDGEEPEPLQGGTYWCVGPGRLAVQATYCTDTQQAMASFVMGKSTKDSGKPITQTSISGAYVSAYAYLDGTMVDAFTIFPNASLPAEYQIPHRQNTMVTDEELARAIASLGPQALHNMLHGVDGRPHMFPEIAQALRDLAEAIAAQTGQQPSTGSELNPPSEQAGGPGPEPDPKASDLPPFCEWATVVCEFIEWVKTDRDLEDVPLPIENMPDPTQNWSSGHGGGSCPAPYSVSVFNTSVDFIFEPTCRFAEIMRPVLIAGAFVIAAFMVAGFRSGNA